MYAQSFAHMSLPIARFISMAALGTAICMHHVPGKNCNVGSQARWSRIATRTGSTADPEHHDIHEN